MNDVFGPLDQQYCVLFYGFTIFWFITLIMFLFSGIMLGISKRKGFEYYLGMLAIAVIYAVNYIQNRLLHTMCIGNIKR